MLTNEELITRAQEILANNAVGASTRPAPRLYPHQWLWDSCFIAIGLRHGNPARAVAEIESLFRGQWKNGMLPHIIFNESVDYHAGPDMWQSDTFPDSPDGVQTSCITQPPMVAEAMVKVGEKLSLVERRQFFERNIQGLIDYHAWLYAERDPENTGLVTLIHAWEAGNEDAPHWAAALQAAAPDEVTAARSLGSFAELDARRPDVGHAPLSERPRSEEYYALYHTLELIKRADFSLAKIKVGKSPLIRDALFNAILCRANQHLEAIAADIEYKLPNDLIGNIDRTTKVITEMVEASADGQLYSLDHRTNQPLYERDVSNLMALYALKMNKDKASQLESTITGPVYWPTYGVASTPTDSTYYSEKRFWQGPVWKNINWLLREGALYNDMPGLSERLAEATLEIAKIEVEQTGSFYEYNSALSGSPAGTIDFSWSAALIWDLAER